MATFGDSILPLFNTTNWTLGGGASISNNVLTAPQWGYATYEYSTTSTDSSGNTVYYNVGDLVRVMCNYTGSTRGRFIIQIYYLDVETNESYNTAVDIPANTQVIGVDVELPSATIAAIKVTCYCVTAGTLAGVSLQFRKQPNTSGSNTTTKQGGGTGTDNTKISPHTFFAGPSYGTAQGEANFRSIVTDDLPIISLAKGGSGTDNSSISQSRFFASPTSTAGMASFRSIVANDLPTIPISKGGTGKTTANDARFALCPDINTENSTDTWVPVMNNEKLQHRVIPAYYNQGKESEAKSALGVPTFTISGNALYIQH